MDVKIKEGYLLRSMAAANLIVCTGGETAVGERVFSLNETGAFMWRLLEQGATKEELLAALRQEYEVDEAEARADIDAFLESLESMGVLEI